MTQTALVKVILEKANVIKKECNHDCLCASHVAAAVADFCETKYTGFGFSDCSYPRFEEERLRYIFLKEVRQASYFRRRLFQNNQNGVKEETFDLSVCEYIASLRGAEILSSDIVFLCALTKLHESYRMAIRGVSTDDSVIALLQDTDANIYDYVIEKIEEIRYALKKKVDEAAAIRDWKPAAKFAEPDDLAAMFFEKMEKKISGNAMTLKFPKFFGTADLKVSIHRVQNLYYIHDNGCAIRHLSKQVKDMEKHARILKRVCHSCWIDKGRITGKFLNANQFLNYLQKLIFVAHADLYYTRVPRQLYRKDKDYAYIEAGKADSLDEVVLLEELKKSISFCYDENAGLYYLLDTQYSLSSARCSFLMETLKDDRVRISDAKKRKVEGQIFEEFYWGNDDIARYHKFILKIVSRFGGEFDGRDVYLTDKTENFFKAMLQFFNLAVLLSEFGHDIAVSVKGASKSNI